MYDPIWSSEQDIANELMIANFLKILENETFRNMYNENELQTILKAIKEHTLNQASKVNMEQEKINKTK